MFFLCVIESPPHNHLQITPKPLQNVQFVWWGPLLPLPKGDGLFDGHHLWLRMYFLLGCHFDNRGAIDLKICTDSKPYSKSIFPKQT